MHLKLLILALAIWVQDSSATVHDISLELASSSEPLPDNVLRKSDLTKLPPAYIFKQQQIPKARIGKGLRSHSPLKPAHGSEDHKKSRHKSNVYKNKKALKKKINKARDEIVHKITPVEVILDVEVGNDRERHDIEKLLSSTDSGSWKRIFGRYDI